MPSGSVDKEDLNTHTIQPREWHQGPQSAGLVPLIRQGSTNYSKAAKLTLE